MSKIEWIMELLAANNNEPIKGITRFEKLLFYYLKKQDSADINEFDYEAYNYGPHSDDIRDLLYALRDKGLIEMSSQSTDNFLEIDDMDIYQEELLPIEYEKQEIYKLTPKGRAIAEKINEKLGNLDSLTTFKIKFNKLRLKKLIQIVYIFRFCRHGYRKEGDCPRSFLDLGDSSEDGGGDSDE